MTERGKRYRAFISYSQKDKPRVRRLHRALEAYRVPRGVAVESVDAKTRRIGRFFRDDEEMAAAADLGASIQGAIEDSEALIVVCSPAAARSRWVDEEIKHFRRAGLGQRIFAVIVGGVPNSPDADAECFPPSLRAQRTEDAMPSEPLALDLRAASLARVRARLVAGLLDVPFDDLWRRDRRRSRTNILVGAGIGGLAACGLLIGAGLIYGAMQDVRSQQLAELARNASDRGAFDDAARFALAGLVGADRPLGGFAGMDAEAELRRAIAETRLERLLEPSVLESAAVGLSRYWSTFDGLDPAIAATSIDIAPDGRLAAPAADGSVRIWDPTTGRELAVMQMTGSAVVSIDFDRLGERLATASQDGSARIWDTSNGAMLQTISAGSDGLSGIVFNPDGGSVITTGLDRSARVWSVATGEEMQRFSLHRSPLTFPPAINDTGDRVVSLAGGDRYAALWDIRTGRPIGNPLEQEDMPTSAAFSADGAFVVTTGGPRALVWNARRNETTAPEPLLRFESGDARFLCAAFSADAKQMVTGAADGSVVLWDVESGRQLARMLGHDRAVFHVEFSARGDFILTAADNEVRLWRNDGTSAGEAIFARNIVASRASPDGRTISVSFGGGRTGVWATSRSHQTFVASDPVHAAHLSLSDQTVITASEGRVQQRTLNRDDPPLMLFDDPTRRVVAVRATASDTVFVVSDATSSPAPPSVWSLNAGRPIARLPDYTLEASFNADGTRILTRGDDFIRVVETQTGREIATRPAPEGDISAMALAPSAAVAAIGDFEGTLGIWTLGRRDLRVIAAHSAPINSVRFSGDGAHLATTSADATACVWRVADGRKLWCVQARAQTPRQAVFSPDGALVAVGYVSGVVRIWSVATGRELQRLIGHSNAVQGIEFSADGRVLVTTALDRSTIVWRVEPALTLPRRRLVEVACERLSSLSRFDADELSTPALSSFAARDVCRR